MLPKLSRTTRLCSAVALTALISAAPSLAQVGMNFNRIASFATPANMGPGEDTARETSAEIIAATADGMTLAYTDSPLGVLGLIDLTDPADPKPLGNVAVGGEPTSVAILNRTAFVGVNTSQGYTAPSGVLKSIDIDSRAELAACALGGQPDSVALAKDGSFVVIAIENERDEDLNGGVIPQMPAGNLVTFDVRNGAADCASRKVTELTGLAEIAPTDPEPEFVDVNALGETVVTLQENNHIAVVDAAGKVMSHFSAGSVTLQGIDATDERGALIFTETQADRLREPDSVKWIDDMHFATANEGDYQGGSRGWTIFRKDGGVVYESGVSFEHALVRIGHYPDKRSDAKGAEPESIEFANFGGTPMAFVGAERASIVGVYDLTDPAAPVLRQLLPSGIAPEGIFAIPGRNLLVTANEADLIEDGGVRSHVMVYQYQDAPAAYPSITSDGTDGLIGWGALSGLVADAEAPGRLYAVNDSFYGYQPTIFTIDATRTPARITSALPVTRAGHPAQKLDMEGITLDGEGGFWVASEGRTDRMIPHGLYHIDARGEIKAEIALPPELTAVETRFGFEGIAKVGDRLWMAVQREWADDPENQVKLVAYDLDTGEWGAVRYEKAQPETGWVGLSEITAHGDHVYVIERDNQIGAAAVTKKIYRIALSDMVPAPLGSDLPVVRKELVRDMLPDLTAPKGYVQDKLEGFAIDVDGTAFAVTDNDGVDASSGETHLLNLGSLASF